MASADRRPDNRGKVMTSVARYLPSPVESTRPALEMDDPQPVIARRGTRDLLSGTAIDRETQEGLVGAVSEVVTNAELHGEAPVHVRGWATEREVIITVTDAGQGPSDPNVGLRPAVRDSGMGGFGLWLAHQMCSEVSMGHHPAGFTVRLIARAQD